MKGFLFINKDSLSQDIYYLSPQSQYTLVMLAIFVSKSNRYIKTYILNGTKRITKKSIQTSKNKNLIFFQFFTPCYVYIKYPILFL